MFKKKVPVRQDNVRVTQYKEVTDWEAVGKAIVLGFIGFVVLCAIIGANGGN